MIRDEGVEARQDRIATRPTEARRNVRGVSGGDGRGRTDGINPSNLENSECQSDRIGVWLSVATASSARRRGGTRRFSLRRKRDNLRRRIDIQHWIKAAEAADRREENRPSKTKKDIVVCVVAARVEGRGVAGRGGTRCQGIDGVVVYLARGTSCHHVTTGSGDFVEAPPPFE